MAKAELVYIVKHNDGDWGVYTEIADMMDGDALPAWLEKAKVMQVEFKPTHELVSPDPAPKLVKL